MHRPFQLATSQNRTRGRSSITSCPVRDPIKSRTRRRASGSNQPRSRSADPVSSVPQLTLVWFWGAPSTPTLASFPKNWLNWGKICAQASYIWDPVCRSRPVWIQGLRTYRMMQIRTLFAREGLHLPTDEMEAGKEQDWPALARPVSLTATSPKQPTTPWKSLKQWWEPLTVTYQHTSTIRWAWDARSVPTLVHPLLLPAGLLFTPRIPVSVSPPAAGASPLGSPFIQAQASGHLPPSNRWNSQQTWHLQEKPRGITMISSWPSQKYACLEAGLIPVRQADPQGAPRSWASSTGRPECTSSTNTLRPVPRPVSVPPAPGPCLRWTLSSLRQARLLAVKASSSLPRWRTTTAATTTSITVTSTTASKIFMRRPPVAPPTTTTAPCRFPLSLAWDWPESCRWSTATRTGPPRGRRAPPLLSNQKDRL